MPPVSCITRSTKAQGFGLQMDAQKHIPTVFPCHLLPSASDKGAGMQQLCRWWDARGCQSPGHSRDQACPDAPLSLWWDRQTRLSAVVVCRTQAPASQELGQATKKQPFETCIYFTLYFSQGCSLPEQLIMAQALRFLTSQQAKHMFKQMFAMKPGGSQLPYSSVANV